MRILIFVFLLFSCGETLEGLRSLNDPPLINFTNGMQVIEDSIKMRGSSFYAIHLDVSDPNDNLTGLYYEHLAGQGLLIHGVDTVRNTRLDDETRLIKLKYHPRHIGYHSLKISVTDNFEEKASALIGLQVFENLPPVAAFTFSRDGTYGRYHWKFDASESYDRDKRYGGGISAYAFNNGMGRIDVIETTEDRPSVYHVIFPRGNTYSVGLRVRDNDGIWSRWEEKIVAIE